LKGFESFATFSYLFSAEADGLNNLIDEARDQLKPPPSNNVKPYDMSVLLDENLEKEKLYKEMKRKIFDTSASTSENPITEGL